MVVMRVLNVDRLINLREKKGLSQARLAEELKVERTTYGKYENRGIQPPNDVLVQMAIFFNVTTDYLLGRTDDPNPAPIPFASFPLSTGDVPITNPDIRMIARGAKNLTDVEAKNLRKYAQFMYPKAFGLPEREDIDEDESGDI